MADVSTAPVHGVRPPGGDGTDHHDEEMPVPGITRRRALLFALFVVAALAFLYFLLPQLAGLEETWHRLDEGDPVWLAAAAVFQVASMASYVAIFRGVNVPRDSHLGFRDSYLITMASLAATRLFAAGGAGGVALTAWALRRSGMRPREVAERTIAFLVLLYAIYMAALVVGGLGLRFGVFPGRAPFTMTVVPAIFGATTIALVLLLALVPLDLPRRLGRFDPKRAWVKRAVERLAAAPASASGGVRLAIEEVRRPRLALLGALFWWACNIGVLYAAFRAFGDAPPIAVLVVGFFVGMFGNLLPLPGGIGGVDGGMIGAFVAFGVSGGLALVAVLVYRVFSFWLPTLPGAIAYVGLRRRVAEWRTERLPQTAAT